MYKVTGWLAWFGFVGGMIQGGFVMLFFTEVLHLPWLFALMLAMPVGVVPVLGTALAVVGGLAARVPFGTILFCVLLYQPVLPILYIGWRIDRRDAEARRIAAQEAERARANAEAARSDMRDFATNLDMTFQDLLARARSRGGRQ